MGTTVQYTLKNGFLDEIRFDGTRVRINEKIEALTEDNKIQFQLVSGISNLSVKEKLNSQISKKITDFVQKHKSLQKLKYIGHIYKTDNDWAIIRTIHIKYQDKERIKPFLLYNIWIIDEQKKYNKINVIFELEFQKIMSGTFRQNKKIVQAGIPKKIERISNFHDKFLRIDFLNKINLFLEHSYTTFEEVEWSINNNRIELKYSRKPIIKDDLLKIYQPDIVLSHKKEIQDAEFNKLHFYLEKDNWLGLFAILTTFFSRKEKIRPHNIRMFKEFHSFSKISFIEDRHRIHTKNSKDIVVYKSGEFQLSNETHDKIISSESQLNSEILEDYLEALTVNFSNCREIMNEVLFILPKNEPVISLLALPFIRYCRGYPLINNENIVRKIFSKNTILKTIFLLNTSFDKDQEKELLNANYKIIKIKGKSKDEFAFNLHNAFIKTKCSDYLVSSYFLVPEEIIKLNENIKPMDKEVDDIILPREEVVESLDVKGRSILKSLFRNNLSTVKFVKLSYDLSDFISDKIVSQILDIHQFTKDFQISYDKNTFRFTNPHNYNGFHAVFIDLNEKIPNLLSPIIYSSYRSLSLIPCNLKEINKEGFSKIKFLYENDTNTVARTEMSKGKSKLEEIVHSKWVKFLKGLLEDKKASSAKLNSEVGLGYITLFLPSTKIPYECLFLGDHTLGSLFSMSRIPIEDSNQCLKIVNHSFRQFIYPKPQPHTLSLIPYLNRHPIERAYTEFISYVVKSTFSSFESSKISRFSSIYEPTDLTNTLKLLLETSTFLFWGHGGIDRIELRGQEPFLELTTNMLESCRFKRPEFAIFGSCNTAASSNKRNNENLAQFFLKKGFLGVCASFWKIDISTAIYGILNILFKMGEGNSLAAIIRKCKYSNTKHFPEVFISFGDPTYRTEFFYENERSDFQKSIKKLTDRSYKSTNNAEFRIERIS